jgi:SAM-dependent methyltransferase
VAPYPAGYLNSVAPHDAVAELLAEMKNSNRSWHSIVRDDRYVRMGLQHAWFTNPQKGAFYRLVATSEQTAFLDVGAGSGIVSACLSPDYDKGYALELQKVFVDFMNQRFAEDAIHNVEVVHGNALAIPLRDGVVDLAAINCLLQWIPHSDPNSDPRQVQLRLLREVRRCLKPGGKVVLAVDNAWHHRQLRRQARNSVNSAPGRTSRRFDHSYFGYRRLLSEAGYTQVRLYVLMPQCEQPVDIYSFDRTALNELFRKYHARMRGKRMIKAVSDSLRVPYLWAYCEAAFYVEATR